MPNSDRKLEIVTEVPESAMVVFAHPDDAEIGSGGVIATWVAAGCEVSYVLCTNGDPYAGRLSELGEAHLNGFLNGSLDLVARLPDGRLAVLDYKTNLLEDYAPDALGAEMDRRHYGLQALLYAVAVHRLLRWRQPSYDPERHLGGVLYLFLRGMAGPKTPAVDQVPCGVFSWRPPPALVAALSDRLDGDLL